MLDILLNSNLDLDIKDGDLVVGESTKQHQRLLMLCTPGDFLENPMIGVGAAGFLKSEDEAALFAEIKKECEKDGMQVKSVMKEDGKIIVDANY